MSIVATVVALAGMTLVLIHQRGRRPGRTETPAAERNHPNPRFASGSRPTGPTDSSTAFTGPTGSSTAFTGPTGSSTAFTGPTGSLTTFTGPPDHQRRPALIRGLGVQPAGRTTSGRPPGPLPVVVSGDSTGRRSARPLLTVPADPSHRLYPHHGRQHLGGTTPPSDGTVRQLGFWNGETWSTRPLQTGRPGGRGTSDPWPTDDTVA